MYDPFMTYTGIHTMFVIFPNDILYYNGEKCGVL